MAYLLFVVLVSYQNCSPYHEKGNRADVSQLLSSSDIDFQKVNELILQPKCVSCHQGSNPSGGVNLSSYSAVMASGTVVTGRPNASRLYLSVREGSMPLSGALSSDLVELMRQWIEEGSVESAPIGASSREPGSSETGSSSEEESSSSSSSGSSSSSSNNEPHDEMLDSTEVDFQKVNELILQPKCVSCHQGSSPSAGVNLSSYSAVMASGTVVPGSPNESRLYLSLRDGTMPPSGALNSELVELMKEWIASGASEFPPAPSESTSSGGGSAAQCSPEKSDAFTRLSNGETKKMIKDLTKPYYNESWFDGWSENAPVHGFDTLSLASWDAKTIEERLDLGGQLANALLKNKKILEHCPESIGFYATTWDNCAKKVLSHVASRAFRRPLRSEEIAAYKKVFDAQIQAAKERNSSNTSSASPIIGWFDGVGTDLVARGWAFDQAWEERPVEVHLYVRYKAPGQVFNFIGATITKYPRSGVNSTYGVKGDHGFQINIPKEYANGHYYEFRAYGIDHKSNPILGRDFTFNAPAGSAVTKVTEGRTFRFEFQEALETVLQAVFVSPNFLYKPELVPGGFTSNEEQFRMASVLSFFTRGSYPDDELWELAHKGRLDREEMEKQALRLLDEYSYDFARAFASQWLGVGPGLRGGDDLEKSLAQESVLVFEKAMSKGMKPNDLLTPGFTMANKTLAKHYGIRGSSTSRHKYTATSDRGGLLTQAYFLKQTSSARESSPIHRGLGVLGRFLCRDLPALDPATFEEISEAQEKIDHSLPVHEKMKLHRDTASSCYSCHSQIDPIGLGLEFFDKDGLFRSTYSDGSKIGSWGELNGRAIASPQDLAEAMQEGQEYNSCFSEKLLTYAMSRKPNETESCVSQKLNSSKQKSIQETAKDAILYMIDGWSEQ